MCKETAYNYLKKAGYTYKKTFLYQERDEVKNSKTKINKENLIFIDESGIDDNEFYAYGWAQKGRDCLLKNLHLRKKGSVHFQMVRFSVF
ncbi:MAG: hypothetical protein U0X86_000393 [Wolbachia endosymbiont of Xenopsylla cheopis]